ncbi:MAG: HD domain-containing protein [Clostridia bacterium]|nr:HD domain-containing protein [Clostridia bacterium]
MLYYDQSRRGTTGTGLPPGRQHMSNHGKHAFQTGIKRHIQRFRERGRQGNLRSAREQAVFLYLLIVFILVSIYLDRNSASSCPADNLPMSEGWQTEASGTVSLSELPLGSLDLTADVAEMDLTGKSLCMKSIDTLFDVYADGRRIYSYRPAIPKRLGLSYGMYVHAIPIPEGTVTLGLHLEPIFPGAPASLNDVMIGNSGQYMSDLFRHNLLAFGRSTVILLIGLFFLAVGIFGKIIMNTAGLDFISFGILCILTGFTGYNDTLLLQVLTQHPSLIRVVTYVCLIALPYPVLSFFASATGNSHSRLVPAFLVLSLGNLGAQVLLTHRGVSDYYYMVYISHAIIILAFAVALLMLIRAIRKRTIQKELRHSLLIGIGACAVGVGIDIVRYYLLKSYGSSSYTRLGVMAFTLLMGVYLFREQTRALKQKQHENQILISEITTAFAKVIDMKDSYTNGHSSRVAKYTSMLARELGYDDETVERYYRIALLHDVGKIGIPKSVLNKPGKLTDEEYDIIKSHTSKGYDVLKDISIMPELAVGAQAHHERPDGNGYPNRLKGDQIPRVAQIIAVADCFDAMYSNRPYRKRMNFEKAVSIIREVSGTQLTPDVVDAFLRLVDRGEFRAPDDTGGGSTENIENIRKDAPA